MRVRKLILPVAGAGKRLRPLTLRKPKALVPLNGGPLLEYVLYEAQASGIREVVLVISPQHLDQFRKYIREHNKKFPGMKFHIRFQDRPVGNGHAVVQAADIIGNEPFAVRFCDDLIVSDPPVLVSLINIYNTYKSSVLLLERVPKQRVSRYGVVGVRKVAKTRPGLPKGNIFRVFDIIEKPKLSVAPSNLTIVGGYVLGPTIMRNLIKIVNSLPVAGTDALPIALALQVELIVKGKVYGWEFTGRRLDCGTLDSLKEAGRFLKGR
ncbi:MAG: sugar phosphate nucleotidyltransferase [Patescibacteria group bacterium]